MSLSRVANTDLQRTRIFDALHNIPLLLLKLKKNRLKNKIALQLHYKKFTGVSGGPKISQIISVWCCKKIFNKGNKSIFLLGSHKVQEEGLENGFGEKIMVIRNRKLGQVRSSR